MQFRDLVRKNRSYRRFKQSHIISEKSLIELIDLARCSASGANRQGLKFHLSSGSRLNSRIFPLLSWAGYLKEWDGPEEGERPSAYITILLDKRIAKNPGVDHGIAAQSILLGASETGLGGCMIVSFKRAELLDLLDLDPNRFEALIVIALGKPVEEVCLEDLEGESIAYWRDAKGIHHVPKRKLEDLIIK